MNSDKNNINMADPTAVLNADDRAGLVNAPKDNSDPVDRLRGIQKQHDELEAKFFEERAALEARYQKLYQPLYAQRCKIVNGVSEAVTPKEGDTDAEKCVPEFWLLAMRNNELLSGEITKRDEDALKYLKDIKWSRVKEPKGFKLDFYFATNPYFKNPVLTKTYHMIDEDDPIAIGTEIEWYPDECLTRKILKKKPNKGSKNTKPITITVECESFFNFFSRPQADELEIDYDIRSTIRDEIIPHAVSWYTMEAVEDDDGLELEEDEEDEEDEDDGEDEGKTKKKSGMVARHKLPMASNRVSGLQSASADSVNQCTMVEWL